jgi:A/G-specific adenine glycosylase
MLQQTQVERVVPKYVEFLTRFPTLAALAAAPTAEVIRTWAPLGYNVRAVRLQQIAQAAVEQHGGSLPDSLEELLSLKGIGRYTAGAIACFAFGAPVATVDTNIRRVLWRVFRGIEPAVWPTGSAAARDALGLAEWALPAHAAYDWQQALMDLGATTCVSRQPRCERCPLARECSALAATAQQTLFPSGEALARLRVAAQPSGDGYNDGKRLVAEPPAAYAPRSLSARRRASQPFTSTSRYFRGRILDLLRQQEVGAALSLLELGPRIKADWSPGDLPWLRNLVSGLTRDGLLRTHERPPRDHADSGDTTCVSLP